MSLFPTVRPKRTSLLPSLPTRRVLAALAASLALIVGLISVTTTSPATAATSSVGLFSDSLEPQVYATTDTASVNLGMKFSSDRTGTVTALQFYRSNAQQKAYQASLWDNGKLLAQTTFAASSTPGWQTAQLPQPVALNKGRIYTVSYLASDGQYASSPGVFDDHYRDNQLRGLKRGGVYNESTSTAFPTTWGKGNSYMLDIVFQPSSSTEPTPTVAPTTKPTPTVAPTTPTTKPTTPPAPPTTPSTPSGDWPNADNTGVPAGQKLSTYTGPMTITAPNTVISNKIVTGKLLIKAPGVKIINTRINGRVDLLNPKKTNSSFTITDSEIHIGSRMNNLDTGLMRGNFHANRVEVTGGRRGAYCEYNCTIENSWFHAQSSDPGGKAHFGGIRMSENTTLRHNNITCESQTGPGTGCSAPLTGYGDFAPVQNNLIENNRFYGSKSGYCAYGGSSGDNGSKPYGHQARNVRFIDNVFVKGPTGKCGMYGAIASFDANRPGNVWSGNTWDDETPTRH